MGVCGFRGLGFNLKCIGADNNRGDNLTYNGRLTMQVQLGGIMIEFIAAPKP